VTFGSDALSAVSAHDAEYALVRRSTLLRIEIDGHGIGAEALWETASAYGHFTAMQVRGRRTRGLELHLRRLEAANRELFESGLDNDRIRWLIRHALRGIEDASVRVYIFESAWDPAVMVTVKEPGGVASPQRLQSVRHQRPDAHLKHLATGQGYYSRLARRNGFDDALLTAADGTVSESAVANIGFFDRSEVVWPDAPLLHGITMQLLESALPDLGVFTRRAPIRLEDVGSFDGAFLANARGVAAVVQIDDDALVVPTERMNTIVDAYASVPWDAI
jgi:branched-subunit amino acid aminotransferase/4-amino-4-deoxychorismate lyase